LYASLSHWNESIKLPVLRDCLLGLLQQWMLHCLYFSLLCHFLLLIKSDMI